MPALRTRDTQPRCKSSPPGKVKSRSFTFSSPATLEVSTDALQPPTLAIISPTPRAFTFPVTHNLTDSPYSSPSHSPFEPDLRSLALSPSTPLPFVTTPESSPSSHRRRKSCSSSDIAERRPRKGDDDYIKRPENAFILFRRKCCEDRQAALDDAASADGPTKKQRQADLSKTISQQWKSLNPEDRQYWENLAKEKKKEHEAMYPNYVYRPQRARDKDGRPKARKSKRKGGDDEQDSDSQSLEFVVPVVPPHHRHHGRSASAPTPPPYQSIQVPTVYQMTPSCPASPSLLPMISRRASHPSYSDDGAMPFDFYPANEGYGHPSSFGHLEPSLQSSEFLQGMFSMAGLPTRRDSLHPLDVSDSMLLPSAHILSPSSSLSPGSSNPSSPTMDPLTPQHSALLAQDFSHLSTAEPIALAFQDSHPDIDIDLQMEMQLQQEYAQYSWTPDTCAWQNASELLIGSNDFDIAAIPPVELDVSKCLVPGSEMEMGYAAESQSQGQGQEYVPSSLEPAQGILAFDQMMAGHGF
ncbi:hypothetical protein C0995_009473 [Termitomyces sp. Mi166|nr:hypothetical protein C0995_009473 [Termitomyces sp. Mi166\